VKRTGGTRRLVRVALAATPLVTVGVEVTMQSPALADTETSGDSWQSAASGWTDLWFCEVNALGSCGAEYYSQATATANLETEGWKDGNDTVYNRLVQDGWTGAMAPEYGYTDEVGLEWVTSTAEHIEGSTQISDNTPNLSLGCMWSAMPIYEPCAESNYNNNGYHFYLPWTDESYDFYASRYGYLGDITEFDDALEVTITAS